MFLSETNFSFLLVIALLPMGMLIFFDIRHLYPNNIPAEVSRLSYRVKSYVGKTSEIACFKNCAPTKSTISHQNPIYPVDIAIHQSLRCENMMDAIYLRFPSPFGHIYSRRSDIFASTASSIRHSVKTPKFLYFSSRFLYKTRLRSPLDKITSDINSDFSKWSILADISMDAINRYDAHEIIDVETERIATSLSTSNR